MTERISNLQNLMKQNSYDLLIIAPSADMRYLCGLNIPADERCELLLVYADKKPVVLLSQLYLGEGEALKPDFDVVFTSSSLNYDEALRQLLPTGKLKIGIDNRMWAVQLLRLQQILNKECAFHPASFLLDEMRVTKSADELKKMQKAGAIAAEAWKNAIKTLHLGMTEKELAAELEIEMKKLGAEALSFDTIVAFGKNAALPHHVPDDTRLCENQFVLTDFGCVYDGYCSDITRTVCFGEADDRMKEIYNKVLSVKNGVKAALKDGMQASEVEALARELFGEYEPAFIHRISHGLGMYVHEAPHFSLTSQDILQQGMVFSVEPGLYYLDDLGVRIEDAVAITENGIIDMHILPDELIEIPIK